jgi:hypothetical protein
MVAPTHFGSPHVAFVSVFLALSKIDGLAMWRPIACPRYLHQHKGGDL